mgnify:CR=1 FL=1
MVEQFLVAAAMKFVAEVQLGLRFPDHDLYEAAQSVAYGFTDPTLVGSYLLFGGRASSRITKVDGNTLRFAVCGGERGN